jgi:hypothetical protein
MVLAACSSPAPEDTVSSINYLQKPVSASCARDALVGLDGFAVETEIRRRGNAREIRALFNDDLHVTGLVRRTGETGEVSFFARLPADATALERKEAEYAVRRADEAVYVACTEDGQTDLGDGKVILEPSQ